MFKVSTGLKVGNTNVINSSGNLLTKFATSVNFNITGDVSASNVAFDGSGNVSLAATLATVPTTKGGTGLTTTGSASQILGVNTGGTALEYKTVSGADGVSVTPAANSITVAPANDLAAIESLAATGVPVRTGTDTWTQKSLGVNPDDIVQPWMLSKSAFIDGPVGWVDLECGATQMKTSGVSAPTFKASFGNQQDWAFVGTGTQLNEGWLRFHIPHDLVINSASKLYFHVHWYHIIAAPTGNVYWQLEWQFGKGYGQAEITAATTVGITATPKAYTTRPYHQIDECGEADAILSTTLEEDGFIWLRVFRDPAHASDTFGNDAFLVGVDLHYMSMSGGSTKEKVYPFTKWYE